MVTTLSCTVVKAVCNPRNIDNAVIRRQSYSKRHNCDNISLHHTATIMGTGQSKEGSGSSKSTADVEDEFYDRIVCQEQDIADGQFKEVKLDDEGKVSGLLIKQHGQLSALSNKCTHYGANLATSGSLGDGVIRCPWHGACFNISSGDIEVKKLSIFFPRQPCANINFQKKETC